MLFQSKDIIISHHSQPVSQFVAIVLKCKLNRTVTYSEGNLSNRYIKPYVIYNVFMFYALIRSHCL